MRSRTLALGSALALLPALVLSAGPGKTHKRSGGQVNNAREAKAIAERDTGGKATSARRILLNGASSGWEVDVHMPGEERGWRCVIDSDTHMVHSKTRIEQPGAKGKAEGPLRVVKGTR